MNYARIIQVQYFADKILVIPFSVGMLGIFTIQKRALKLLTYHVNLYLNLPHENDLFKNAAGLDILMFSRILCMIRFGRTGGMRKWNIFNIFKITRPKQKLQHCKKETKLLLRRSHSLKRIVALYHTRKFSRF